VDCVDCMDGAPTRLSLRDMWDTIVGVATLGIARANPMNADDAKNRPRELETRLATQEWKLELAMIIAVAAALLGIWGVLGFGGMLLAVMVGWIGLLIFLAVVVLRSAIRARGRNDTRKGPGLEP